MKIKKFIYKAFLYEFQIIFGIHIVNWKMVNIVVNHPSFAFSLI